MRGSLLLLVGLVSGWLSLRRLSPVGSGSACGQLLGCPQIPLEPPIGGLTRVDWKRAVAPRVRAGACLVVGDFGFSQVSGDFGRFGAFGPVQVGVGAAVSSVWALVLALFAFWVARFGCGAVFSPDTLSVFTIFGGLSRRERCLDKPPKIARCGWVSGEKQEERSRRNAARCRFVPRKLQGRLGGEPGLVRSAASGSAAPVGRRCGLSGGCRLVVGRAASVGSLLPFVRRVPLVLGRPARWEAALGESGGCRCCSPVVLTHPYVSRWMNGSRHTTGCVRTTSQRWPLDVQERAVNWLRHRLPGDLAPNVRHSFSHPLLLPHPDPGRF
jgi:hypothetical protein